MSELKDKYVQMAENLNDSDFINSSNFLLPDINEMVEEDLMAEIYEQYVDGDVTNDYKQKDVLDQSFYSEQPFSVVPGYYPEEGAFVLRVDAKNLTFGKEIWDLNKFDGDTWSFSLSNIDDGGQQIVLSKHNSNNLTYKDFKTYFQKMGGGTAIQIRALGIDSAEIPHYEIVAAKNYEIEDRRLQTTFGEVKKMINQKTSILYEKYPKYNEAVRNMGSEDDFPKFSKELYERKDDEEVLLWRSSKKGDTVSYVEIITTINADEYIKEKKNGYTYFVTIAQEESVPNTLEDGYRAQQAAKGLLTSASEIMLVLNANGVKANKDSTMTTTKTFNSIYYADDIIRYLIDEWDTHYENVPVTNYSYIPFGMDNYKRSLGVVYVKCDNRWINLNKYILCKTSFTVSNPSFNSSPELQEIGSGISSSFNLWSYDRNNIEWLDSFDKISSKSYNDRIELHKKITGIDFLGTRDCSLLIGDTLMLIPPESIRNVTQVNYERIPNMRSKGTMAKNKGNNEHLLEIVLYFYEDAGINGIEHTYTSPNGKEFKYKMNGLRSLIAQFKIAPFLPIENGYINDVLGIEAVSLQNMNIQNVEGFPRLLKVILTLREFNYRVYMPDMPLEDITDTEDTEYLSKQTPMFAKSINWEIFRYYYQRALIAGKELLEIEEKSGFASYDYNLKYYTGVLNNGISSTKTPIGEWLFCGELSNKGEVSFYIPDEDWLNSALQVKKEKDNLALTTTSSLDTTEKTKEYIKNFSELIEKINETRQGKNEKFNKALENFIGKAIKGEHQIKLSIPLLIGEGYHKKNIESTKSSIYVTSCNNFENEFVVPIMKSFCDNLNNTKYFKGININETINKDNKVITVTWDFCIKLNLENILNDELKTLKELISKEVENTEMEDVLVDDCMKVSYRMAFKQDNWFTGSLQYNENDTPPYADTFYNVYSIEEQGLTSLIKKTNEDEKKESEKDSEQVEDNDSFALNQYNQEIDFYVKDYKNPANMPFVPFIENVQCANIMGNIANTFTDVSIKAIEGMGPQYMGGQDTQLELELITDDITIVTALNTLPTLASAMAKRYRRILPAWPIKIRCDFTRMLGVSEVLIDMMEVSTVEGFPGIYTIKMRLTSVDRTQRSKEALRRLDVAPQGGKVSYNYNADLSIKNYFALDNALSKAELYPDLDIPSLDELGQLGFRFIKYSNQNRSYPDPDFYMIYNYPYTASIIKKLIKNTLSEKLFNANEDESIHSFKFKDIMGMEITGKIEAYTGISLSSLDNEKAKNYSAILNKVKENMNEKLSDAKLNTKELEKISNVVEMTNIFNRLLMSGVTEGWEIKPSWRAPLASKETNNAIKEISEDNPNVYAQQIKDKRIKAIELIDSILNKPIKIREYDGDIHELSPEAYYGEGGPLYVEDEGNYKYKKICEDIVNEIFCKGDGYELIKLLCPSSMIFQAEDFLNENEFPKNYFDSADPIKYMVGFLFAAGCALSGNREYNSSNKDNKEWYPNHYISDLNKPTIDSSGSKYNGYKIPYCVCEKIEGASNLATSMQEAISFGSCYGAWRINKYDTEQLISQMTNKESDISYTNIKNDSVYKNMIHTGFLDPYYNKLASNDKELFEFKKNISLNKTSNAEAFLRIVLLCLRKMICDGLFISELDIIAEDWNELFSDEFYLEFTQSNIGDTQNTQQGNDYYGTNSKDNIINTLNSLGLSQDYLKDLTTSIRSSGSRAFCARLAYPFLMAVTECNQDVYNLFKTRDYNTLNGLTGYVENGTGVTESRTRAIKFLSALSGISLSLKDEKEKATVSESQKIINSLAKEIFIQASEDPRAYLVHSFYDMLTNDKRGRLVRAFPTYYVVFVDEGRKIGSWKLHDNFYNMNSISSINVVKSRKIAADTCTIVMNNMFNSYTMEPDSTTTQQYTDIYGMRDVFDSIFSPQTYFDKEKNIRLRQTTPDTVLLQPGIRIHVRMGYSADGSKLPVVFNGKVAEVGVEEVAQIVAQGDGHEFMNPLNAFGQIEAVSLDVAQTTFNLFKDIRGNFAKGGESPRDLLATILTAKYGGWKKVVDEYMDGRWFNDNPFGIMHFGDPKFGSIFEQGEVVQNLYEVADTSLLKGVSEFASNVTTKKATPTINTSIQDKTFWDLLHLAADSGENYIGAIRDFGFRSTVFLGKPNHYYAYAYEYIDGKVVEKRKPFQQFHYYDSYTDIVYNSIKASEANMKTNATGIWQSSNMFWGNSQSTVGPIYLDMNIYPEYQKSMTMDTTLIAAGNGGIDSVLNYFSERWTLDANDDKVNKALAWRITANGLKNSVKDMYQGDVAVLGDPSVKPYDRVYIHDTYEDMMGMFEVEAVVHNMSIETGFTTSIMPDVIARHGDSHETAVQSLMSVSGAMLSFGIGSVLVDKLWAASVHGKLATVIGKADKMYPRSSKFSKIANGFYEAVGMKDFLDSRPTTKALFGKLNILPSMDNIDLAAIDKAIDYLLEVDINKLDDYAELVKAFDQYSKLNIDKYEDLITQAVKKNKFGVINANYSPQDIEKKLKEIKDAKKEIDKIFDVNSALKKVYLKDFASQFSKINIDGVELIKCLDTESARFVRSWFSGNIDEAVDITEQISKVMSNKDVLKAIKDNKLKTNQIDDLFDSFKALFNASNVDTFTKSATALRGGSFLDDLTFALKGLVKMNWVSLLIDVAIETMIFVFAKNTQEMFNRFLLGIQAIDVYPLMKNNKPLVAGMNGHKGSVQGWPVKDGYDSIQGMIIEFTNSIKNLDGNLPIADWILGEFVDMNLLDRLAEEWKYDLGLEQSSTLSGEDLMQSVYNDISNVYAANNKYGYSLATTPRISKEIFEKKDTAIFKYYQLININPSNIGKNEKILALNYLTTDASIRKAITDKRFEIAHSKNPTCIVNIPFESGIESVPVKIQNGIIDLPLVQDELIFILNHLLTHESLKSNKIVFKSGTRVNDETGGWKSTGFAMTLEVSGEITTFKEILNSLKESTNVLENSEGVFDFSLDEENNKVVIIVYPPAKTSITTKQE